MNLRRWIEETFVGPDARDEKDREIVLQRSIARNSIQAVQSGARLVENMSGMLKLMADNHAK